MVAGNVYFADPCNCACTDLRHPDFKLHEYQDLKAASIMFLYLKSSCQKYWAVHVGNKHIINVT